MLYSFRIWLWNLGWNSSSVWCGISSICVGPRILRNKGLPVFSILLSFSYYLLFQINQHKLWDYLHKIMQLRVVRAVAVLGGLLQIFLFMCLCGITVSVRYYNLLNFRSSYSRGGYPAWNYVYLKSLFKSTFLWKRIGNLWIFLWMFFLVCILFTRRSMFI